MSKPDVVRAWKDPAYRAGLDRDALAQLPANPAGLVELSDEELKSASGLASNLLTTAWFCTLYSFQNFRNCCP